MQIRPLSSNQQAGSLTSYPYIIHPVCSSIIHISSQVLRIYSLLQTLSIPQDVSVSKSHPAAQEPNAASLHLRGYNRSRSSRRPCLHHISLSPWFPSSFRFLPFRLQIAGQAAISIPPSPFPHPLYPNNMTVLELEATEMLADPQRENGKGRTYICFPPKINLCCTGGIPSFSSTFSLICDTYISHHQHHFSLCPTPLKLGVKGNGGIPDNQARCRAQFPCL